MPTFNQAVADLDFMNRCFVLAQFGKGAVAPNPMVGAVLVHDGKIIAEGFHHQYGADHAEVDCLNHVKPKDRYLIASSTMYVNLEPCTHFGNTPPCADRLIAERIQKVVIANVDPNPLVAGKGVERLTAAGIDVQTGVGEAEGNWLNRRFFCAQTNKRPYIILKWAQTANGFFCPIDRSTFSITNQYSKKLVHKWRTEEAAIMVGYNTALSDNPMLTSRLWPGKNPLRIVIDRSLNLPAHLHVFDKNAPTWVLNELKTHKTGNTSYHKMDFGTNFLSDLTGLLHQNKVTSIIVEGGIQLLNTFILTDLWDEARIFNGANQLHDGLPAPLLTHATLAFPSQLMDDTLNVYTNSNQSNKYVHGMEL